MENSLKKLIKHAEQSGQSVKKATTFSILNKVFDLAPPILIGMAVDIAVQNKLPFFDFLGVEGMMPRLFVLAFMTFLVWGFESWFEYLFQVEWRTIAQNIQHSLRYRTYEHLQNLRLQYFEDKTTGNLTSIVNDDVNQLERFLDGGANDLIQLATTIITIGGIFFYLSPNVAMFSFFPIPFIVIGSFLFQKKIAPRYEDVRKEAGLLGGLINGNLAGLATIKSYLAERFELDRLQAQSDVYSKANSKAIRLSSSFSPLIRMLVLVGFLGTLIYGGYQVEQGIMQVGDYSVMIFMTQRLLWPLTRLGQTFDLYQRAMASVNRIFDLLDQEIEPEYDQNEIDKPTQADIDFRNLTFRYQENGPLILDDVSFSIPAGATIGIVGPTGSGKSTLTKLLLRFYKLSEGTIEIDGGNINSLSLASLRQNFSYAFQDAHIFHGTVADNIGYGTFEASQKDIEQAALKAEADEFIQSLPEGYQTIVGERGQKLSGGQKQRLAIARAILKDAPCFVFDETTSNVDNETEAAIQKSLNLLTQSKTTIIIAHRLSTVVHADCIYVLEKGKIVQKGTHDELAAEAGLYQNLWKVQTGL